MELTRSLIAAATLVVVASSRADVGVVDVSDFGAVGDGVTDSIKGTQQNRFEHHAHITAGTNALHHIEHRKAGSQAVTSVCDDLLLGRRAWPRLGELICMVLASLSLLCERVYSLADQCRLRIIA